MQKEIQKFEFVQGVNFEFTNSSKNNNTKYLLIFDNSCEQTCNSKGFFDITTILQRFFDTTTKTS